MSTEPVASARICGRLMGMRLVPVPLRRNAIVCWPMFETCHFAPSWKTTRYCGMSACSSRHYVAMYGRPLESVVIDVWLISSCLCGIGTAISALAALMGSVYGSPVLFSQVLPPSMDLA